jgi:hypothetical protein
VVVPTIAPSTNMVITDPTSLEPVIVGLLLLNKDPLVGDVIIGAIGAVVSTVNAIVVLAGDTLLAASVALAYN